MDNRQLHYFVTIAELGSIAAASRSLHIAQPALTRQVQGLEVDLGVELFHRHARGVTLTQAGKQLYQDAVRILNALEKARTQVVKADRGDIGFLKIAITPQHLWMTEVQQHLAAFRQKQPDIALNICTMHSRQQIMALRNGEIDAGIMFLRPQDDPQFLGRFLYEESLLLAIHKETKYADHPPQSVHDLWEEPFVWPPEGQAFDFHKLVMDKLHEHDFTPMITHEGCDYNAMLSLVSAGRGYTFVPAVTKYQAVYNVEMYSLPELDIKLDLEIVWRKDNDNPCLPHFTKNYHPQMTRLV